MNLPGLEPAQQRLMDSITSGRPIAEIPLTDAVDIIRAQFTANVELAGELEDAEGICAKRRAEVASLKATILELDILIKVADRLLPGNAEFNDAAGEAMARLKHGGITGHAAIEGDGTTCGISGRDNLISRNQTNQKPKRKHHDPK